MEEIEKFLEKIKDNSESLYYIKEKINTLIRAQEEITEERISKTHYKEHKKRIKEIIDKNSNDYTKKEIKQYLDALKNFTKFYYEYENIDVDENCYRKIKFGFYVYDIFVGADYRVGCFMGSSAKLLGVLIGSRIMYDDEYIQPIKLDDRDMKRLKKMLIPHNNNEKIVLDMISEIVMKEMEDLHDKKN